MTVTEMHLRALAQADAAALRDECRRLRVELEQQKRINMQLAERLAACSAVLGRAAERGKVCGCQTGQ